MGPGSGCAPIVCTLSSLARTPVAGALGNGRPMVVTFVARVIRLARAELGRQVRLHGLFSLITRLDKRRWLR